MTILEYALLYGWFLTTLIILCFKEFWVSQATGRLAQKLPYMYSAHACDIINEFKHEYDKKYYKDNAIIAIIIFVILVFVDLVFRLLLYKSGVQLR